ncbi:MAG TPA: DUF4190 domain-containing protein [Dyella sp.]|nr:DUF4190 domain-containing protein [Dyella sp.]
MNTTSAPRSTCTLAVVSLCFGIAAWTVLPFIGAIVAVICGHLARREIRETVSEPLEGDGFAVTGLVLGYAQLALSVLTGIALLFFGAVLLGFFAHAWS